MSEVSASCMHGFWDKTKSLINQGFDFNIFSLIFVGIKGNVDFIEYLIDIGVDITIGDNTILRESFKSGKLDNTKYLISNGGDCIQYIDHIVYCLSRNKKYKSLKYLLENFNFNINKAVDALRWACRNGNLEIVKLLIENGVDPLADNKIAFRWAKINNQREISKYLSKYLSTCKFILLLNKKFRVFNKDLINLIAFKK